METGIAGWRLTALVSEEVVTLFADALEPICDSLAMLPGAPAWRLEAFVAGAADPRTGLVAAMALTAASLGREEPPMAIEPVLARDWLAENRRAFPPMAIGRFFVHGSHHEGGVPAGKTALLLDAATAFGSGEHPSTRGCLLALTALAKRRRAFGRVLDMGCGSGILMIAAARLRPVEALGVDIDPGSAATARRNARLNKVGARVRALAGDGYAAGTVRRRRPYGLIFANILAKPLRRLAPDLARALAPGGVCVLAGLLERQAAQVIAAHAGQGVWLRSRVRVGDWTTLVMGKR